MKTIRTEFVEFVPSVKEEGVLYISMIYATAVHKCMCGCGNLVVTPFSPTGWELTFDGEGVSLSPSIGNWDFPCKSHYWIKKNKIIHARKWSDDEIDAGIKKDKKENGRFFKIKKNFFKKKKK